MNAVQQFNALDGRVVTRKELLSLKDLAVKQGHVNVVRRVLKALKIHKDEKFTIKLASKLKDKPTAGMNAARHKGLAKVGLDECGRPLKGYYFAKGGVLTKVARNKKGEYIWMFKNNKRGRVESYTSKNNIFTYTIKLEDNSIIKAKEQEFAAFKKKPKDFKFQTSKKDKKVVDLNPDHENSKPNFNELAKKAAAPKKEQRKIKGLPDFSKESTYADDFDFDTLMRSRYWISFTPDKSARNELKHWKESLAATYNELKKEAESQDFSIDELNIQFNQFYKGLLKRKRDVVSARSRTASSVITGPANFPTRKAQAASSRYHDVQGEYFNYSDYKLRKIRAKIYNREGIKSGEVDTLVKLQEKLEVSERNHKLMVAGNAALRTVLKKYKDFDDQLAQYKSELLDLGLDEKSIKSVTFLPERDRNWVFGRFATQNSSAKIRNIKKRIESEKKRILKYASGSKERNVAGIKVVENVEANRLQLLFDGKPDENVRNILKKNAFRWSPRYKAWQRQLTNNAIYSFNKFVLPKLNALGMNATMSCSTAGSKLKSSKAPTAGAVLGSKKCKSGGKVKVANKLKTDALEDDFSNYEAFVEEMPKKLQKTFEKMQDQAANDGFSYEELKKYQATFNKQGYHFDYDLDAEPYGFKKISKNSKKKDDHKPVKVDDKGQYGMFGVKPKGMASVIEPIENNDVQSPVNSLIFTATASDDESVENVNEDTPVMPAGNSEPTTSHNTPVQRDARSPRTGVTKKNKRNSYYDSKETGTPLTIKGVTGEFFGKLEVKPKQSLVITLDADAGAGKTTAVHKFMKDIAHTGFNCAFLTLEQHKDSMLAREQAERFIGREILESTIIEPISDDDIKSQADLDKIVNRNDFIIVDSFQKLRELLGRKIKVDHDIRKRYDGKIFILIFQRTKDGKMRGGSDCEFDGDIIVKGKAGERFADNNFTFYKNRYANGDDQKVAYNVMDHRVYDPTAKITPKKETTAVPATTGAQIATVYA